MTREQARREIDSIDFYLQHHTDDYSESSHTAMMMAISALEQSNCDDCKYKIFTNLYFHTDPEMAEQQEPCDDVRGDTDDNY